MANSIILIIPGMQQYIEVFLSQNVYAIDIPYCMKILHGIKFYRFMVAGRAVKLTSINFYYYIAKISSCFDSVKFKMHQLSLS